MICVLSMPCCVHASLAVLDVLLCSGQIDLWPHYLLIKIAKRMGLVVLDTAASLSLAARARETALRL